MSRTVTTTEILTARGGTPLSLACEYVAINNKHVIISLRKYKHIYSWINISKKNNLFSMIAMMLVYRHLHLSDLSFTDDLPPLWDEIVSYSRDLKAGWL